MFGKISPFGKWIQNALNRKEQESKTGEQWFSRNLLHLKVK
jgi:hypothetical protein